MGSSHVSLLRFAALNLLGATLWAVLITGTGYIFGLAINSMIADIKQIEEIVLVVMLVIGFLFWLWRRHRT
jgi:membrane protein DedA with SNARE-associated domain